MARSLISAGASIAFGGDFRRNGFTPLLAELIQAYNQTAASSAPYLHSYLGAPIKLEDAPDDLPLVVHHLVHSPDVRPDAMLPPPSEKERHPDALYFSDMRRVMAKHTSARIILGGAAEPRTAPGSAGYAGRYPGVVEEAWRTLEAGKPLYVIGGFGGAAALVADVLEGAEIPGRLRDQNWDHLPDYQVLAATIDNDPFREKLGLPRSMEDLANALRAYGDPCLKNDESSLAWNGLTVEENRILFRTRDPVAIASLVLRGMLKVSRAHSAGKLEIELIHGSVTSASNLDAVAVAVFDNIPLGGAGAVLDQAIGGHASQEREQGRTLISLTAADVDADWLYLASLGSLKTAAELEQAVEKAARETAEQSQRHGFRRLGVVTFGGAVLSDIETMAHAMLRGFAGLNGAVTVVWFETNADRFNRLQKTLSAEESVQLTTRKVTVAAATPLARAEDLIFQVSLHDDELRVTMLPPAGSAIASSRLVKLSASDMAAFSAGGGLSKRETPDLNALKSRGVQLAATLIGKEATQLLSRCSQARVMIIHDVASSRLPFEILSATDAAVRPAVQAGLSRRLAVDGVPLERLFARPPKAGRLQALLIVNPTEDLPSTLPEAAAVRTILKQQANVELVELAGKQATKQAVLKAFASADVLHYCGHAFFNGPGADQSGLILAGPEPLTLADLADCPSLPRVAFVNACEAGRVRGNIVNEAAAFAELFLRSGVEAYLGTYWQVRDTAASTFAAVVYTQLADGHTLDAAVTEARSKLLAADEPDWANYILYGDGRFQLIAR